MSEPADSIEGVPDSTPNNPTLPPFPIPPPTQSQPSTSSQSHSQSIRSSRRKRTSTLEGKYQIYDYSSSDDNPDDRRGGRGGEGDEDEYNPSDGDEERRLEIRESRLNWQQNGLEEHQRNYLHQRGDILVGDLEEIFSPESDEDWQQEMESDERDHVERKKRIRWDRKNPRPITNQRKRLLQIGTLQPRTTESSINVEIDRPGQARTVEQGLRARSCELFLFLFFPSSLHSRERRLTSIFYDR